MTRLEVGERTGRHQSTLSIHGCEARTYTLTSFMARPVYPQPIELTADDGVSLSARVFDTHSADMTVLVLPGIGVPQRAFRHVASWFSEHGARCLTLDYRGVGESRASPEEDKFRNTADLGTN